MDTMTGATTEPAHLSQVSTNNLLQNVTRSLIPEVCAIQLYLENTTRSAMTPASPKHESSEERGREESVGLYAVCMLRLTRKAAA